MAVADNRDYVIRGTAGLVFLLIFILSGCGGSSSSPEPELSNNQQPTAMITATLVSTAGQTVTLDGSSSSDPDGDTLSFLWEQMEGPNIVLSDVSKATLSFVAPKVLQSTQFTFQLTVDDGDLSNTASFSFQLSASNTSPNPNPNPNPNPANSNQQPNAVIAAPQAATSGQTVTLNGSSSSDPDGDTLSYQWTQASGSKIVLSNSSSSTLTFVAPAVSQATQFTFQLTVNDGALSNSTTVSLLISPIADNTAPSIVSRSPQPNQSGVALMAEVSAGFDEALLETSVDTQSLLVIQNGSPVAGVVSYDSVNHTVTNKPTSALAPSATYTVTLADTLKDLSGNAFAGASWSFTTTDTDENPGEQLPPVKITEEEWQGTGCYKIEMQMGTVYFEKDDGVSGLKSLIDPEGNDWISSYYGPGPSNNFRGFPNAPGDFGHAGRDSGSTTIIVDDKTEGEYVILESTNDDFTFQYWFFNDHIAIKVLKSKGEYCFLWEGVAGGEADAEDFFITGDGEKHIPTEDGELDDFTPEWIYVGDPKVNSVMFFGKSPEDDAPNENHRQIRSGNKHNMDLYSFGRTGHEESYEVRGMSGNDHICIIGFTQASRTHEEITQMMEGFLAKPFAE